MQIQPALPLLGLLLTGACGTAGSYNAAHSPSTPSRLLAAGSAGANATTDSSGPQLEEPANAEALVIEGFITARVDDVEETTDAIREKTHKLGGRVVQETGDGAASGWKSFIRVRLPPTGVQGLIDWIDKSADIVSKRVVASDVSKELFDQALALENLHKTMARMQALLERSDLDIEAVLKIEAEMSRVRAEIERIKGEQRFLKDRVSFATLEFTLNRRDGVESGPATKFMPGLRLASMSLLDASGRTQNRLGVGFLLRSPEHRVSYELDVFEGVDGDKRALIATVGGAAYSDHLGGGRRRFFNPYLGMRVGYGRLEGSNFVATAEAGLELFKHKFMVVDVNLRGTTFFGSGGPDVALVSATELSIAF